MVALSMKHDRVHRLNSGRSLFTRRRVQFAGALVVGGLAPFLLREMLAPGTWTAATSLNALWANALAVVIAFWMRLSIETFPGIRSSYVILPAALTGHGMMILILLMTRLPYDRLALSVGFGLHVLWNYFVYLYAEHRIQRRIAVVPFGAVTRLSDIGQVQWLRLQHPRLQEAAACHAIVADFSANLPSEWEAFLADAALSGRIVYQVKQLSESLTGRVELQHLSENSFGSLLPARGYFHFKALADFTVAVAMLPLLLPLMGLIGLAIRLEGPGSILFRQARIGYAGKRITVYKFRTMRPVSVEDERLAAITGKDDDRITRVGGFLRRTRLDELPQLFNILMWQMSWIGPRPEAEVLSIWYTSELPFYRYRHVVKPGISGWAQVNQGHVAAVEEVHRKLQYDFYYIKYFSPWLDLLIVLRTIKTMLTGFGSR
jgi:lipopolysaccharide/colanic/teichoic acid biosynthesis glycosyltransferase